MAKVWWPGIQDTMTCVMYSSGAHTTTSCTTTLDEWQLGLHFKVKLPVQLHTQRILKNNFFTHHEETTLSVSIMISREGSYCSPDLEMLKRSDVIVKNLSRTPLYKLTGIHGYTCFSNVDKKRWTKPFLWRSEAMFTDHPHFRVLGTPTHVYFVLLNILLPINHSLPLEYGIQCTFCYNLFIGMCCISIHYLSIFPMYNKQSMVQANGNILVSQTLYFNIVYHYST